MGGVIFDCFLFLFDFGQRKIVFIVGESKVDLTGHIFLPQSHLHWEKENLSCVRESSGSRNERVHMSGVSGVSEGVREVEDVNIEGGGVDE